MDSPDPIEAIKFRMEQQGLRNRDLVPYIGSAPKVTEILNGTRELSLNMICRLSEGLGISVDVLIREPMQKKPVGVTLIGNERDQKISGLNLSRIRT